MNCNQALGGSLVSCLALSGSVSAEDTAVSLPNIVVILADDMGIDSVQCLNEKSKIPTPNIDRLVSQGMLFTDAHSGSAVCTPTRYGVLTGRYAWRSRLKRGIVGKWERSLIEANRLTVAKMLKEQGYTTAAIGKWHLGWDWPKKGGGHTQKQNEIDFIKPIGGGPSGAGFDYYFGDDVPNWPPFCRIENNRLLQMPTENLKFPAYYVSNNGIGAPGWKLEEVLPEISKRSVRYIKERAKADKPFFLYFAMTSPHTPVAPSQQFLGKSGISRYADWLMETDFYVGEILKALEDAGIADNTLVFFTADNGTSPKCYFDELRKTGTDLQNHWRGMKADIYEGGHRVPLIVRRPGHIIPGSRSDATVSLVDIMATCADVAGYKLPDNAAEDSFSLMPLLLGEEQGRPRRDSVICHSIDGSFALRRGKWKLEFCAGSGGWSYPNNRTAIKKGLPKWQLYDLDSDPKERHNVIREHPELVKEMTAMLKKDIERGRSTPGTPQPNDAGKTWWPQLPWARP